MKAGYLVTLRSGGPTMTVTDARDGNVHVAWGTKDGKVERLVLPEACFVMVALPDGAS